MFFPTIKLAGEGRDGGYEDIRTNISISPYIYGPWLSVRGMTYLIGEKTAAIPARVTINHLVPREKDE